jgi:hypothetical protein
MVFHNRCIAGVLALVSVLAVSGSSKGEPLGHMAYLTFNRPVALPGVSLAPGTYIFELAAPIEDHSLVRVSSRDRKKVYLTAFTNAVERPNNVRDNQMIVFGEAAASAPPPIAIWYPYGTSTGREFIYRH